MRIQKLKQDAYFEGFDAFRHSIALTGCPYASHPGEDDQRSYWDRGWYEAKKMKEGKNEMALKKTEHVNTSGFKIISENWNDDRKIASGCKPEDAEELGFARFNRGPHLCVDIPDGTTTISCRTSDGQLITFSFLGGDDLHGKCAPTAVDILHHTSGRFMNNGERKIPVQSVVVWTNGQALSNHSADSTIGCTNVTVSLNKK